MITALVLAAATAVAVNLLDVPRAEDAIRDRDVPGLVGSLQEGDALRLSLGNVKDVTGRWSVAFPRSASAAAAPFLVERPYENLDTYAVMAQELAAGAYAVDGLRMEVTVEGKRNEDVNILNIHPLVHAEELVDGPSIYMGTEGGGATEHLAFDLDSPQAVPMRVDYQSPTAPFFDDRRVSLKNGETDTFVLDLSAVKRAYSFTIEFDYEVGGRRQSQILDMHGQPFRVTPSLCPAQIDKDHPVSPAALADRARRQYSQVLYSHADPVTSAYTMVEGDPGDFCSATSQDARQPG